MEGIEPFCDTVELVDGGANESALGIEGVDVLRDCDAFAFARSESFDGAVGLGGWSAGTERRCVFLSRLGKFKFERAEEFSGKACVLSRIEFRSETRLGARASRESFVDRADFLCAKDNCWRAERGDS